MIRRAFSALLIILAIVAWPAFVSAQEPKKDDAKKPTVPADGTEILQYLLDRARIKPVTVEELRQGLTRFDDVIVISLGNPHAATRGGWIPISLATHAMQFGGAAMIAADSAVDFRAGNFAADAAIPNGSVYGRLGRTRPASLFLKRDALPFVVPKDPPPNGSPESDLFEGMTRIATNKPSFILNPVPINAFRTHLATYPSDCFVFDPRTGREERVDPDKHLFAVGGSGWHPNFGRTYRFLTLADPSVFINQMMVASDENGPVNNLVFAARVVEFLAERDDGGRRTRCVLYQNGEIVERFDTLRSAMQPPLPLPNFQALQEKLTEFVNRTIDNLETKDAFNQGLVGREESTRNQNFKWIMRGFLILFLIRIVYYLLKRTWSAKRPPDGPAPPSGGLPSTEAGERPPGIFDRRQRELLRRNNLYEPVRVIIREMFHEAGAPADPGKRLPEVEISDVVTKPDTLVDALTDLWKIAYGPARVVTVQRWRLLEPLFERVRQAHAEGKWRFV